MFLDCRVDADCYKANNNLSIKIPAATTDSEKAKRCCMKQEMYISGTSTAALKSRDAMELKGEPTKVDTYTKICNYDYPSFFKEHTNYENEIYAY